MVDPRKKPFFDCFWIDACSQALFEFHKALKNVRTQGLMGKKKTKIIRGTQR